MPATRNYSRVDRWFTQVGKALNTLAGAQGVADRPSPAHQVADAGADALSEAERRHAAGLMRVNHAGEICAQALYQGQALCARSAGVERRMQRAAAEEADHLAWCKERLEELGSAPSRLDPLWYALSLTLGAGAAALGDRMSLGFVAATEEQVGAHLESHLRSLPERDARSRAVVEQMLRDELQHARAALEAGGADFPRPIKQAMALTSKVMTHLSYRV
ncbi:MAG: 2-polyprenyl-3-methyl-6-methoxy-1,4-benzoquinone monooxygenase [Pseudomonadota bacterium]|nr:2-polyprenyl-3-methyl-6-methoxy-1,4-benzoquinone monooxygenase [Pseudomonadota bacterium]